MKKKLSIIITIAMVLLIVVSCQTTPRAALLDMKAYTESLDKEEAFNLVMMELIDKGFDIKMSNGDIGLITTEYKKFGAYGDDPPFDFYLQIRTVVSERPDGKIQIMLTPIVKEANRINAAAYTERELYYYNEEQEAEPNKLKAYDQVQLRGQLLFLNVAIGIADGSGLSIEQLEQNIQLMEK